MNDFFYFKYDKNENAGHYWSVTTEFCDEPEKKQFYLSAGDWDGVAGDLDEWAIVSYEQKQEVFDFFVKKYPDWKSHELEEDAVQFRERISTEEMKNIFSLLYIYCMEEKGDMHSFLELMKENKIKCEYSAYRSSSDW
ncbi:MAG: hypothetical protein HUK25_06770 [Treponema sp.]|nr:hypothetical protein [Treponema sp.]